MADNREREASAASSESHGGTKASASEDRKELDSLKRQVGELSEQVQRFLLESAGAKGREAAQGVREVKDNLAGAIDASLKNRPYTTLAMAFGFGFLFGRLK